MKTRQYFFDKDKLGENQYKSLLNACSEAAMLHSKNGSIDEFMMPGNKIVLQFRQREKFIELNVKSTAFFQPKYIQEIVDEFNGEPALNKWSPDYIKQSSNPMHHYRPGTKKDTQI